ncbi:SDR family oxidoreductase [Streptomyces galilaeus]|uniref:SDR family oxidoreductase n=1 Tax=Streptomyces galilaeus TaxID=33899 RepID=UPI001678BD93|nr:SDR family oxidoreductase [Streptomyces galilaeus]GGW79715.1 oxidoreductase [Streptomyces galilaeus]
MRVFVTGASGWIGSAVVPELISHDHQVTALARSDAAARALREAGAEVVRGSLDDLDTLHDAAAGSEGVIHLAFKHDAAFSGDFKSAITADRAVVTAIGGALAGTDRPFIATGGTPAVPDRIATEHDGRPTTTDAIDANSPAARAATDEMVLALSARAIRSAVLRLPRAVYGENDPGFTTSLIATARNKGVSGYIGDGSQRWPVTHRLDTARAYRLALEKAPAGSLLNIVGQEGVTIRSIAETIARHQGVPLSSVAAENALEHFGWLGALVSLDQPASSAITRDLLGWRPMHPTLLEDLDRGHYFR